MSLDVSDPRIPQHYSLIRSQDSPIDWCSFGYQKTTNKLSLYGSGAGGVDQLRESLTPQEVQYGFLKVEGRIILWTFMAESIGGVKRARALVHSRSLTNTFKSHHAQFLALSPSDFSLPRVHSLLRLPPLSTSTIHSRTVSNPNSVSSPTSSTSADQSFISNSSTIQPHARSPLPLEATTQRTVATGTGTGAEGEWKGKGKSSSPTQFDLYHEYENTNPHQHSTHPPHQPPQLFSNEPTPGEDDDRPPELPEKPPSPYLLNAPLSTSSRSTSPTSSPLLPSTTTTTRTNRNRNSLSPPSSTSGEREAHQGFPILAPPLSNTQDVSSIVPGPFPEEEEDLENGPTSKGRTARPYSESPAARMMLSPHDDERFNTIYHSVEEGDEENDADLQNQQESEVPEKCGIGERDRTTEQEEDDEVGIFDSYGGEEGNDDVDETAQSREMELEEERRRLEELRLEEEENDRKRRAEEEFSRIRAVEESRLQQAETERLRILAFEEKERERIRLAREEAEERERTRRAQEEMRLMVEREKLERKLREEEETRRRELERLRVWEEKKRDLVQRRDGGEVMLKGEVSVQGAGSMLWRRRYYELRGTAISFSKSQAESSKPLDVILTSSISSIIPHPDEPLPPHSFKILLRDEEEEWLFYGDDEGEKEMLIEGLKVASRL
ncbi:uncharacterized protein JCM6883_004360 [Sporobolomyces salmoneus]|uniref:uncharacterized protein n=1 Tax=Sporobolomyces salmoneus TaxID=183962 RepID=UPI00317FA191